MNKRRFSVCRVLVVVAGLGLLAVPAQASSDDSRYGLRLGLGVVDTSAGGEIYFSGGFGFRVGKGAKNSQSRAGDSEVRAYIEPEIAYWESDGNSDLLLGVNLIGLLPSRHVDFHIGVGFGLHQLDVRLGGVAGVGGVRPSVSDDVLGGNLQVGVEIAISDSIGFFGIGRVDVLEDIEDNVQPKIYGGLRFNF